MTSIGDLLKNLPTHNRDNFTLINGGTNETGSGSSPGGGTNKRNNAPSVATNSRKEWIRKISLSQLSIRGGIRNTEGGETIEMSNDSVVLVMQNHVGIMLAKFLVVKYLFVGAHD